MKILLYPDPRLRIKTKPVTKEIRESQEFKDKLAELIEIAKQDGLGLASNQLGWNLNLFVTTVDSNLEPLPNPQIFINPEIIYESTEKAYSPEGCLSIPGFIIEVPRPKSIVWTFENLVGEGFTANETYKDTKPGYYIRLIQHEISHNLGLTIVDLLSDFQKRKFDSWLVKQDFYK